MLALVFAAGFASVCPAEEPAVLAEKLVDSLGRGDFSGPAQQFDGQLKKTLTADGLKEAWGSILQKMGKLRNRRFDRIQKVDRYDAAFVFCLFDNGALETKVTFDDEKRIVGLFFLPPRNPADINPPPYAIPERFQEIAFEVGTGAWTLPGTLALPVGSGTSPVVILVHGSGASDRDETVGSCKPFRDLAQGLASKGIAVLRYDKRTLSLSDRILEHPLGFTVKEEVIDDVTAAISRLTRTPGIDPRRIYVLGHSLGGYLVPRMASADPRIKGFILLAALAHPLEDAALEQATYLATLETPPTAEKKKRLEELTKTVAAIKALKPTDRNASGPWLLGSLPGYWLDLRGYKPTERMASVTCPMLVLQGNRDFQVTGADFTAWKAALAKRTNVRFIEYPMLNHLFVKGQGSSVPDEYNRPGNVSETVVKDIAEFVLGKTKP